MRKIIILLIITIIYSCDKKGQAESKEEVALTEAQKQLDIDAVKRLVSDSFQAIFSDIDTTAVSKYYTKDFILLENGVVWNNDSINQYMKRKQMNKPKFQRLNRFEVLKSVHNQNSIWVAYDNYATFVKEQDTLRTVHWLESAVAKKVNNTWQLQQLHSTVVRNK